MQKRWLLAFNILLVVSLACATLAGSGETLSGEELEEPAEISADEGSPEEDRFDWEPNPLNVTPVLEEENTSSVIVFPDQETRLSVTASDGTIFTLMMPVNAVLSPVEVSMTPVAELKGFAGDAQGTFVVHLEPEGLTLMEPAILSVQPGPGPAGYTAFTTFTGGKELHLTPSYTANGAVNIPLMHFSDPGVTVTGEQVLLDIQESHPPSSFAAYWQQAITDYYITVQDANRKNELIDAGFNAWYQQMKEEVLIPAQSNESLIDQAITEYLRWVNMILIFSSLDDITGDWFEKIGDENDEARQYLATGLWNALDKIDERCTVNKDPDEAVKMLRYYAVVEKLNLWNQDNNGSLDKDTVTAMLETCVRFRLKMESKLVMTGEGVYTHETESEIPVVLEYKKVEDSFSSQLLELRFDGPIFYKNFSVTGLPASCSLDKGSGEIDVKVYLGLNFYEDPPRFDEEVMVLMYFPEEPWEKIDCSGGLSPFTLTLWVDLFRVMHRVEAAGGGGKLLFRLQKTEGQEHYAGYSSNLTLEDLAAWIENAQDDPAQQENLESLNEYGSAVEENSSLRLFHLP